MAVKVGYKQTEVGVIPEDWDALPLGQLGSFKNGINKSSEAFGHGAPFVNLMDVFGVSKITSGDSFGLVDTTHAEQQTYDVRKGDVIFIRSSVKPSGVGLTAVVEVDLSNTVYSGFLIRFRDSGKLSIGFKRHCFYDAGFRKKVIGASSVSANTNINQENLKKLFLAVPPTLTEQTAIATALSDADALIESIEKLIYKKFNIKQGAMQELLTGKKRLPGFEVKKGYKKTEVGIIPEDWDASRLGRLADIRMCKRVFLNQTSPSGDIPFFKIGTFGKEPDAYISWELYSEFRKKYSFPNKSDVLLSAAGSIGKTVVYDGELAYFQDSNIVWLEIDSKRLSNEYLYYCYQGIKWASPEGSTISRLYNGIISDTLISLPPTLAEQAAIATILSDMDAAIAALEEKLNKAKAVKQGMMQELLTGRVRLV